MAIETWSRQARKGVLELCILLLLEKGEMYGYDVVKLLSSLHGLVIAEGTVYPLLSRLKKEGLLKARIVESSAGPPRKYYAITSKGIQKARVMFESWMELSRSVSSLSKGRNHV